MFRHPLYHEDIESILRQNCNWQRLKEKTVLITGATGLIGTVLVDMFVFLNEKFDLDLKLVLVSRKGQKSNKNFISYLCQDIQRPLTYNGRIDFVIHAASNTHPVQYAKFPIETITTNVFGTYNLLELAARNEGCRLLLVSSVEVYGEDLERHTNGFSESDMGYLDCNTSRACYNESKRLSETLCQAFLSEKHVDFVTVRLCRCYGATLRRDDTKALSQFLWNALDGRDIVLKSDGSQYYSYLYVADAASALIFALLNGASGEAYNAADGKSNVTLRDLAVLVADSCNAKVVFDVPSATETSGFSKAYYAILNPSKLQELGWKAQFSITEGIRRTISMLEAE